jgi:hypothetical protein
MNMVRPEQPIAPSAATFAADFLAKKPISQMVQAATNFGIEAKKMRQYKDLLGRGVDAMRQVYAEAKQKYPAIEIMDPDKFFAVNPNPQEYYKELAQAIAKAKPLADAENARQEISTLSQPAGDAERNDILDNMNFERYRDRVLNPRATPEQIQSIASKRNVPLGTLQGEYDTAMNQRTVEQVERIPQGQEGPDGTMVPPTRSDAYQTIVGSTQTPPTPETQKVVESLPTAAQLKTSSDKDESRAIQRARLRLQSAKLDLDRLKLMVSEHQKTEDVKVRSQGMIGQQRAELAKLDKELAGIRNPKPDVWGETPDVDYARIAEIEAEKAAIHNIISDIQLIVRQRSGGEKTVVKPIDVNNPPPQRQPQRQPQTKSDPLGILN